MQGGDGDPGGRVVVRAVLEGRVHAGVDADRIGSLAPGSVSAEHGGLRGLAHFLDAEQFRGAGELPEEPLRLALVQHAQPRGFDSGDRSREVAQWAGFLFPILRAAISEAARGGKSVHRRQRGTRQHDTAEVAERGANCAGRVEAGERELAIARTPPEPRQGGAFEFVAERRNLPEVVGGARPQLRQVKGQARNNLGEVGEQVTKVILLGGAERVAFAQVLQAMAPVVPRGGELRRQTHAVKLSAGGERLVCRERVRIGVGDAARQVVGLIHQQERARRGEARLLEEEAAIARGKDVVVVADPDVVERECSPRDLVRTDLRVAAGLAQRGKIPGVQLVEIEPGQAAAGPALGRAGEIGAGVPDAMKGGVDAVLGLGPHLPDGERLRRRSARGARLGGFARHRTQRAHDLKLAGGFAGQVERAIEVAGP